MDSHKSLLEVYAAILLSVIFNIFVGSMVAIGVLSVVRWTWEWIT